MQKKIISLLFFLIFTSSNSYSSNSYFPAEDWESSLPKDQGISQTKIDSLIDLAYEDKSTMGIVVISNGKVIGEKYAKGYDSSSHGTSWSMAKSYYAALIGISIDRGEITSLDDKVKKYLAYFNDERSNITIRDLLNMSSGLDFPEHEHERMFFQKDHLDYAQKVGVEKAAGIKWEYNNVNSMIIGDILYSATGKKADILFEERILKPLNINSYKLWKDEAGNVLAYCCVDMSARDYSKIGLLFARDGYWGGKQILSKNFIDETFQVVWGFSDDFPRSGYSLHWWVGKHDDKSKIFHTSGKFGQYTFVDRENDIVVTRITKYQQKDHGDIQKWGPLGYFRWLGVEQAIKTARILLNFGLVEEGIDVITPTTEEEGESKEFVDNFEKFVDQIANLSRQG